MKKTKLLAALLCTATMLAGSVVPSVPAMADAMKVVTLGADLSDEQKNTMMKYFNVNKNEVQILTITNQDERDHLSGYVPLEQIGNRTVSCAYVKPTSSGGIRVRTANLNWVTGNMIASTLSTSGVKNCEVIAACPFQVSGTGALTGIQMAYEKASGQKLDVNKKKIATQEMVVTGNLADQVGQKDATAVINQAKIQVIGDNVQNADEIQNIVVNVVNNQNINVSQDQIDTIVELLQEIADQGYDYEDVEETLERIDDTVTGNVEDLEEGLEDLDDEDSILNEVDSDVLGPDVVESSTDDPDLVEVTTVDESDDDEELWDEESDDDEDIEVDSEYSDDDEDYSDEDDSDEDYNEDDLSTDDEEVYDDTDDQGLEDIENADVDYLSDEAKERFEKAKTFVNGEYKGDLASLQEVLGIDAVSTVTLDSETAQKLSNKVLGIYLDILGNGALDYVPTGEEKYVTAELNMLQKKLKDLFAIDLAADADLTDANVDFLGTEVSQENKETLYKDTMHFFEVLYGETTEQSNGDVIETPVTDEGEYYDEDSDNYDYDEEVYEEDDME